MNKTELATIEDIKRLYPKIKKSELYGFARNREAEQIVSQTIVACKNNHKKVRVVSL
jgi:hypothetical protein